MQAFLGRSHEAIEQRDIEAVQVLQRVEHAELGPQVEMQRSVANGREVDENDIAMRLLQRDGGIDGGRGAACAALGAEEREYPRFARAAEAASARGTEAGKSFEQGLIPAEWSRYSPAPARMALTMICGLFRLPMAKIAASGSSRCRSSMARAPLADCRQGCQPESHQD